MIEFLRLRGPLDDEQLAWIVQLYGPVDSKYTSLDYVRHQFVDNPFGWSANVFAVVDGEAVGHCGVIPFRARIGDEPAVVGKLEALAVARAYRGRRPDGRSVAIDLLSTLYDFALDNGLKLLFGLAPPAVARIHVRAGCRQLPLDAPAYVLVSDARTFGRGQRWRRRAAGGVLSALQNAAVIAAEGLARILTLTWGRARLEQPEPADAELVAATAGEGRWTVSGADAWEWYVGSGVLRTLEIPGRFGSRAIVRVDESAPTTIQIVAWRPRRSGLAPALLLVGAAARAARRRWAPTLRFQPWNGRGGDGELGRACRLLGFVRRPEADLLLNSRDSLYDDLDVQVTPFFYVTF